MTTKADEGEGEVRASAPLPNALGALSLDAQQPHVQVEAPVEAPTADAGIYSIDRKSTRLNSSHSS